MDKNIKRGIDLQKRLLSIKNRFSWWGGKPINKLTFLGLAMVFALNIVLVSPVFFKDVTPAFKNSTFLVIAASVFERLHLLNKVTFFSLLSGISLSFAPVNIYLFTRRMVNRNEITAFLATLLFVIPNPISGLGTPLIFSLLTGDGAHVVVFSFLPLFLLYFNAFVEKGILVWGVSSAITVSLIAIVSPFSFINTLIFCVILTISQGFMGTFRTKLKRLIFVLISALCLSFFWYYPAVLNQILLIKSVGFAFSYFWKIFPIVIPIAPVFGFISFLIFDRKEKLQPLFLGISFLFSFLFIIFTVSSFNSSGVLMPQRYNSELIFSKAFFTAIVLGFLLNFGFYKILGYSKNSGKRKLFISLFFFLVLGIIVFMFATDIFNLGELRQSIAGSRVYGYELVGVGSIVRNKIFPDFTSVIASLVSLSTLGFLIYILTKLPVGFGLEEKK